MNIEEHIIRAAQGSIEDKIEIGHIAENFYKSDAGAFFLAVANGLIQSEAATHYYEAKIPADRILGRIEGIQKLINAIELAIRDKDDLTRPIPEGVDDAS